MSDVSDHDSDRQLLTALATIQTCRAALDEVRAELADCRAERDRYIERCRVLDRRIDAARYTLEGRRYA